MYITRGHAWVRPCSDRFCEWGLNSDGVFFYRHILLGSSSCSVNLRTPRSMKRIFRFRSLAWRVPICQCWLHCSFSIDGTCVQCADNANRSTWNTEGSKGHD